MATFSRTYHGTMGEIQTGSDWYKPGRYRMRAPDQDDTIRERILGLFPAEMGGGIVVLQDIDNTIAIIDLPEAPKPIRIDIPDPNDNPTNPTSEYISSVHIQNPRTDGKLPSELTELLEAKGFEKN